ncbi:MAG: DUF502 domain-containing protein [Cellvibrionales bacterium]|nr:DUF502 domain-containing protein [Cellvibrionales bacterium]
MKKLKSYIGLTLLGGLLVILPFVIFVLALRWLLTTFSGLIEPLSLPMREYFLLPPLASDALVVLVCLAACLIIGLLVRTAIGRWLHNTFDHWMVRLAPGYKTIRGMIQQLLGGEGARGPLNGEVVLARIFGPEVPTTMTGILTSRHADGTVTVYVPTAPVPTSGLTYHLPPAAVEYLTDVSVEEAMRTIIACGAGTAEMLAGATRTALAGPARGLKKEG